ncbi:MAG: tRNA glutamyl-Q(34) synthetase GluQRS [Aliishimia sp.]
MFRTRFAPSPTGPLHLGHAYSACLAHDMARAQNGEFVLRIEDIDQSRARDHWTTGIYEDLTWLGLTWDGPVLAQSDQIPSYRGQLKSLWDKGLLYVCTCKRRDILAAISAPQEGVPMSPDGILYPGTCRTRGIGREAQDLPDAVLRLDMKAACHAAGTELSFQETGSGPNGETGLQRFTAADAISDIGDIVLARRDMGTSYHLSVVMDDALQNISHVVRGQDLYDATRIHVILQKLLGLATPLYHHHDLIRDDVGKRLAKRDDARAISRYKADGATPQQVRARVGL